MENLISGHRLRTEPTPGVCTPRADERRLPEGLVCCPGCGMPLQKAQLKWAVIERLLQNTGLSIKERLRIIRVVFPEDTFDPYVLRKRAAKEKATADG